MEDTDPQAVEETVEVTQVTPKLGPNLDQFWQYDASLDSDLVVITPSDSTVLDVLGKIPLPPGEDAPAVMAYLKGALSGGWATGHDQSPELGLAQCHKPL